MDEKLEQNTADELILTYLQEGLKEEEEVLLFHWIGQSEANRKYFEQQVEIWTATAVADTTYFFDAEKAFHRFQAITGRQKFRLAPAKRNFRTLLYRLSGAAAAALLIAYFSFQSGSRMMEKQFSDIVVEAPIGSKSKMYLPDGTLVWLNAGSKITYSQGFGVKDRNVELSGEAYFEVARNEKLPFDVNTQDIKLEVLGTKFNFRNYPNDPEAVIELLEGKVQVENRLREMPIEYLSVNEKVVLNKKSGEMLKQSTEAEHAREWTSNILFFDEEPLSNIIKELERSYGQTIRLENPSLHDKRFYGYFNTDKQNLVEVLDILMATGYFRYEHNNKGVIIIK